MEKICTKCKILKPETDYQISRGKYISICRVCKNEQCRQYRKNRTPHEKKMARDYYEKYCAKNAERLKAQKQKYYQANRDTIIARSQQYRESCRNGF